MAKIAQTLVKSKKNGSIVNQNDVLSTNKNDRRLLLENLLSELKKEDGDSGRNAFFNAHHTLILKCFRDESEACRDLALKLMSKLLFTLNLNDYYLTYIFPVLVERLADVQLVEDSEELRLLMVSFLKGIIVHYLKSEHVIPFFEDTMLILSHTVKDKYPRVKITSSECISLLADVSLEHFEKFSEQLVTPLLESFKHQQYKVRASSVKAACVIALHGPDKVLETILVPLATKLFDQMPAVRQVLVQQVGLWLKQHRNRYSHFHRMLPLMLTTLTDDSPAIREEANQMWREVGEQYRKENEKDLHDEFMYQKSTVWSIGCKELVRRNAFNMIGAVRNEMSSWQDDVRLRCAQLLCTIAQHCEHSFTQYLQTVLPILYVASVDEDQRVIQNVLKTAEYIGKFTPADTWCKIILPALEERPTSGHLKVLKALVDSSETSIENLCNIVSILSAEQICHKQKVSFQYDLVLCSESILKKVSHCNGDIYEKIYTISLYVIALCTDSETKNKAQLLLDSMPSDTTKKCISTLLRKLEGDASSWSAVINERRIFNEVLSRSNDIIDEDRALIEKLTDALNTNADADARLVTFEALAKFLKDNRQNSNSTYRKFLEKIVTDIVVPNLIWCVGRKAEAIRSAAMLCLCHVLCALQSLTDSLVSQIMPLLVSSMADHSPCTRLMSLQAASGLIRSNYKLVWSNALTAILTCLDDPMSAVRLTAVQTLREMFDLLPEEQQFLMEKYRSYIEHVVNTLFIHVDDQDAVFQESVLDVIKKINEIDSKLVMDRDRFSEYIEFF